MSDLSLEQRFQLRQLRIDLDGMSRQELIETVLEEREDFLLQGNYFRSMMKAAGFEVEEQADMSLVLPETEEDLVAQFGYVPSNDKVAELINERIEACQEAARMDVDIEAIVLGMEEQ